MNRFGRRIWGWMFFDWACQPFFTLLLTFVFAPYFTSTVVGNSALGQQYWGWMLAITGILIAVFGPILGATADRIGNIRNWIAAFLSLTILCCLALWWSVPGGAIVWPLVVFGTALFAAETAAIFANAMLPSLGRERELGLISGAGWAFGYAGGIISLTLILLFFAENEAGKTLIGNPPAFGLDAAMREGTRSVGPLTAIWIIIFMTPFFLWTSDRRQIRATGSSIAGLMKTLRDLPGNSSLFAFLGSSMLYRDALNGLYAFGGIYAAGILGWSITQIGIFGFAGLVCGALCAYLGGYADRRWGPKLVICTALLILIAICLIVVTTNRTEVMSIPISADSSLPDSVFLICGCFIGAAGGTLQAASRTMMVCQGESDKMTEAFGLYALAGKATAFLAPLLIAVVTGMTGNQQLGITPVILLFTSGLILLNWVNSGKGIADAT